MPIQSLETYDISADRGFLCKYEAGDVTLSGVFADARQVAMKLPRMLPTGETRALLMASSLASPFLVLLAREQASLPTLLGSFVLASSLASTISASVWGYMADASSRVVMLRGGALAALVCLTAGGLAVWQPAWSALHWLYPVAFFVLAIAHAGVRIGRKTYLVDMAGGNKRTDYTAVSNTVIGALLLVVGGISALVAMLGTDWALVVLGTMGAAGVASAWRLKDV